MPGLSKRVETHQFFCDRTKRALCDVTVTVSSSCLSHGRVTISTRYRDPNSKTLRTHTQSQSWFKNRCGESLMCVCRFSLPDALKRRGIGTRIWAIIYDALPDDLKGSLLLTGSLSATDALVPRTDSEGRLIIVEKEPEMLNQIGIRNRFWGRMLAQEIPGKPPLWCDEKGAGAFRGFFKRPE